MVYQTINFKKLQKLLQSKYPAAYNEFRLVEGEKVDLEHFNAFFETKNIRLTYKKTIALTSNRQGTHNFRIVIKNENDLKRLNRTSNNYSYYGLNSLDKAAAKALAKAFEILECLITGKEMPVKRRSVKKL